ncbi:MAG TPA: MTH1187 family thiamine-binding protein [Actinomycetales bacterium]|nr:MTH1187 family thiamine-binding protein [Actinomycetales bacterium]
MLVAFSVAPTSAGESVSEPVAAAVRVVRDSGLPHQVGSMFTTIEGEWDEVFDVIRRATEAVGRFGPRVQLVIKADIRPGHTGQLDSKVERVEQVLTRGDAQAATDSSPDIEHG